MAITYKSNGVIEGLVSDVKPTTNIQIGTIFIETNYVTPRTFRWNGTSWNILVENGFGALRNKTIISEFYIRNGSFGSNHFESLNAVFGAGSTGWTSADTTDGNYRYYGTGVAGAGSKQGRATSSNGFLRKWKPRLYSVRKVLSSTTNVGSFVGFASVGDGTNLHATAPLPSQSGIGVGYTTDKANYQIISNDGSASCTFTNTNLAKDTTVRAIEIWSDDTNWYVIIEGANSGLPYTISSGIPAQTTGLYATWGILTNDTTDRYFYLYKMATQINTP